MENFKKFRENKNISEIEILLKTSPMDLLKSIARRYKLSVSTKKKNLILKEIVESVKQDKPFMDTEPAIHQMSLSQLKIKARQLNIDVASLSSKSDFQVAILKKTSQQTSTSTSAPEDVMDYKTDLETHSQTYLKTLAKQQYGIKVAKLNKKQLILAIIDAVGNGKPKKDKVDLSKDISKMKKNELIVKLQTMGFDLSKTKGKSKADLLTLYKNSSDDGTTKETVGKTKETPPTTKSIPPTVHTITSVPISKEEEISLTNNKKMTIKAIRDLLKHFKIIIPKKTTLRKDLIHLLTTPSPVIIPEPAETPSEIVQKKPKKKPTLTIETDIVALDDIDTPFSPVPIKDLLDEPSEKQLQDELYRCLTFYDHKP
jgi:hypothetical protein